MVTQANLFKDGVTGKLHETPAEAIEYAIISERKKSAGIFHGAKKIVIGRCMDCPLKESVFIHAVNHEIWTCTHASTEGWKLYDMESIPVWCPLEDN